MNTTDTTVNTGQAKIIDPRAAAWLDALCALVTAAAAVDRLWPSHTGEVHGYPAGWSCFTEELHAMIEWRDQELDAWTIAAEGKALADALTSGARHDDAAGALCIDADGDGLCDVCHIELSDCGACGGKGYHKDGCAESEAMPVDDEPVIVTAKGRAAVAAMRGAK